MYKFQCRKRLEMVVAAKACCSTLSAITECGGSLIRIGVEYVNKTTTLVYMFISFLFNFFILKKV